MKIRRTSIISGVTRTIDLPITQEQYILFSVGTAVQNAFPHLSPNQREFILSGVWGDEWETYFGMDES
jgi:hypothetical protein